LRTGQAAGDPPAQPVALAVIARAHGLKGEVAIHRFNPESTSLAAGESVWLEGPGLGGRWVRIRSVRGDRVFLEGIADRNQAAALRGAQLSVDRGSLPEALAGEYYLHDLLGCEVIDAVGRRLGTLTGVQVAGTKEYFVIQGARDVLLPVDAPILAAVDLEAATMHLNVEVDPEDEAGLQSQAPSKG
jgi:16S rRNA processing protein RimM